MAGTQLFKSLRNNQTHSLGQHSDSQLMARFVGKSDSQAFEEVVRRHGPMIMGLCRGLLDHDQDAEDVFQAAFTILARKAGTIGKRKSLASWLYKVAYRLSLRARANRARQRSREEKAEIRAAASAASLDEREIAALVDEEVQRLPEKYRDPVLLCYLQGRTTKEAAFLLDCPSGTIKIRLLRARKLLKKRLARRGIGLSVLSLLAVWADNVFAAVPGEVHSAVVRTAIAIRCCRSLTMAGLSQSTQQLVDSWQRRLALAKLKLAGAVLVILGLFVLVENLTQRAYGADRCEIPMNSTPAVSPHNERPRHSPTYPLPDGNEQFISFSPLHL